MSDIPPPPEHPYDIIIRGTEWRNKYNRTMVWISSAVAGMVTYQYNGRTYERPREWFLERFEPDQRDTKRDKRDSG